MNLEVQIVINGSKDAVWNVITDIENSTSTITGIEKIEVLEKPENGLLGLKWRETRTLFGRTATEVMWITDVEETQSYKTRAESHGAVYVSRLALAEKGAQTQLTMSFEAFPLTFMAKVMSALTARFAEKATKEALMQDLVDIKAAVEKLTEPAADG